MTAEASAARLPRHLRPRAMARRALRERIQRVCLGLWSGKTLDEIAAAEGIGKRRLQRQMRNAGLFYPSRANHLLIGAFVARKHSRSLEEIAAALGKPRADVVTEIVAAALADDGHGARRVFGKLLPRRVRS